MASLCKTTTRKRTIKWDKAAKNRSIKRRRQVAKLRKDGKLVA